MWKLVVGHETSWNNLLNLREENLELDSLANLVVGAEDDDNRNDKATHVDVEDVRHVDGETGVV